MLKAIIVGLGSRGRLFMRNRIVAAPRFQLLAGIDPDSTAQKRMREIAPDLKLLSSYERALAECDCDVVFVLTPSSIHDDQVKAALEAGKHVYVEKPFTRHHRQAIELTHLAEQRGLKLMVGQNMRYVPVIRALREKVQQGAFGQVGYLHLTSNRKLPNPEKLAGHPHVWLYDNAVHDWDQILAITGKRPTRIFSVEFDTPWSQLSGGAAHSVIEFANGLHAVTEGSFIARSTEFRLRMETEKTTVLADSYHSYMMVDTEPEHCRKEELPADTVYGAHQVVDAFADYVEKNIEPECSARNNLRTMQMICAAIRSSEERQPVDIPESDEVPID